MVADDIHGAEVFSNPIGVDGLQTGDEQLSLLDMQDWDALSTFDMEIYDDQDGVTLNIRVLRKRKLIGNE